LADTNWATVIAATTIKHPYKIGLEAEDDDGFFMGYRFSYCPDCKKEIAPEPTAKEMKEMTRFWTRNFSKAVRLDRSCLAERPR
jgi:sodium/hydrogen exchanger 10/11